MSLSLSLSPGRRRRAAGGQAVGHGAERSGCSSPPGAVGQAGNVDGGGAGVEGFCGRDVPAEGVDAHSLRGKITTKK